tara:strand:+ start:175 stop:780 length:606 start_codon:yes stop_codon:yes gene_type:complete
LSKRGDKVIATCRSTSKDLEKLDLQVESGIDITSKNSILNLKGKLADSKIDVMIHNAGIAENNNLKNISAESLRRQFEVNAVSPLLFIQSMLKNLGNGSKVILITSRMGSIEDNTSGGSYGYRMSKVALCMAGKSLSIDLKSYGISVALLHPGLVRTRMTGFTQNGISTEQSAIGLIKRIDSLSLKTSGNFWHANGEQLPW